MKKMNKICRKFMMFDVTEELKISAENFKNSFKNFEIYSVNEGTTYKEAVTKSIDDIRKQGWKLSKREILNQTKSFPKKNKVVTIALLISS